MEHYDVAIIGSGSGNTIPGDDFADKRVALIDAGTFGGTCLNAGCIPSKMWVLPADMAAGVDVAGRLGVDLEFHGADWRAIRDRIFTRIDPISVAGRQYRRCQDNLTLYEDEASFVDPHTLTVGGQQISADQIVLAAGSRPRVPDVPGIDDERWVDKVLTSDQILRLDERPDRLVILGGGFIAAEFAHVFSALGSKVTVVNRSGRMLRREDDEISRRFTEQLSWSVSLRMNEQLVGVGRDPGGHLVVETVDQYGVGYEYPADIVLNATGRVPNGDRLNLRAAGVRVDERGFVVVDEHQRTSQPHIWALGDVCSHWELKHVANAEARVVAHNLLHPDDLVSSDHRFVPHAVFSDPQVASVGRTEQDLRQSETPFVSYLQEYADVAYGWALEDTGHCVKLLGEPGTGRLLGAHVIGPQAASIIQPLITAMSFGIEPQEMARGQYWIHPALPEVVENALLGLVDAARTA
ncbi:mycothione reductase [Acidipropionibacterium timonense]|uniref:mycothione reductase n=1 Tax=Acidipropionibacterium timonense TaxID=2161818 RepID=UPI0010319691|nr:mycothione reductase [Acidipropionibacterium timonense]